MLTLINNATIVNEGRQFIGSVVIDGEFIIDVMEGAVEQTEHFDHVVDATDLYLFPGVIDDHVHFREPGLTHKADIATESRTAAAGGVTSVMEMPNTVPQTTTYDRLEEKFRLGAENSRVNYSFFYGATNENIDTLKGLDPHRVPGVKLFMGSSTGNTLFVITRAFAVPRLAMPLRHLLCNWQKKLGLVCMWLTSPRHRSWNSSKTI